MGGRVVSAWGGGERGTHEFENDDKRKGADSRPLGHMRIAAPGTESGHGLLQSSCIKHSPPKEARGCAYSLLPPPCSGGGGGAGGVGEREVTLMCAFS